MMELKAPSPNLLVAPNRVCIEHVRREILQGELGRLEEGDRKNSVKFNEDKCKAMPLGWHNQRYQDRLESICLRRSLGEKDLEILDKIT